MFALEHRVHVLLVLLVIPIQLVMAAANMININECRLLILFDFQ